MKKVLLPILGAMLLQGCASRIGDLTVASTKNINLKSEAHQVDTSRRLQGEDRIHIIFFIPTSAHPNLEDAIDNAVEKAPGAVALSDVTIRRAFWYIPLLYGQEVIEVEGNPVFEAKDSKPVVSGAVPNAPITAEPSAVMRKSQWQSIQLQRLQEEKGLSYEEYQRRYKMIMER